MGVMFGDTEPEDAWHPDDPSALLIENLHRRVDLLSPAHTARDRLRVRQTRDDRVFLLRRRADGDPVSLGRLAELRARLEEYGDG